MTLQPLTSIPGLGCSVYDQANKRFACPCGFTTKKKPVLNQHIYFQHHDEAKELMDWITYSLYY